MTIYSSDDVFERALRAVVQEELATYHHAVAQGRNADWGQYRQQVGIIQGLERVLGHCDDIRKKMDGTADGPADQDQRPTVN